MDKKLLEEKWIEWFRKQDPEKRKEILYKIFKKYTSKEYINRELKLRYNPEYYLADLLILYGIKYGKPIDDPELLDDYFGEEKYLLEDYLYVSFIYGGQEDLFTIKLK